MARVSGARPVRRLVSARGDALRAGLSDAFVAALASDDADAFLDEYLKLTLVGVLSDEARAEAGALERT